MQAGTQILIDRMKSHPEEFVEGGISRWARVIAMAQECLPDEDKDALHNAYAQLKVERFNEAVFKELAGEAEPEPDEDKLIYKAKNRYATGWTDPRGIFGTTPAMTLGSNGSLGIGTVAPNPLTVNTSSGSAGLVVKQDGSVDINGDLTVKGKIHANGN